MRLEENEILECVAAACHMANRAYCQAIGDDSQPVWADAPQWQKDSAIAGVKNLLDHPDTTPEQSHESWLAVKTAEGWKHGPVKDVEKKEHHCFLPYAELPEAQRKKDHIFLDTARQMILLMLLPE